ncbi:MAG: alpha/beta fold hydrolase [Thermoguttaceae bacterium]
MSLIPPRLGKPRLSVLSKFLLRWMAFVVGLSLCLNPARDWAQDKADTKTGNKADEEDIKPPDPEPIDLVTEDGLQMKATYFPGTKGQESIPVILLHGFNNKEGKHSGKDFTQDPGLALFLQEKLGCAVIVPDLRGHGESTRIKVGKRIDKLDGKPLRPAQIAAIVTEDLRAVKGFLWKQNNEKKLNLCKLAVIGVDEGAALALSYAAYDAVGYEQGEPKVGPLKLGKFVKAAAMISPVTKVTGLNTAQVMKLPEICRDLPVMIAVGNKSKERFAEADRLRALFVKARPPADDDKPESITVWFYSKIETSLQGIKLLAEADLKVPDKIVAFMTVWLVENADGKDYAWRELKRPYE